MVVVGGRARRTSNRNSFRGGGGRDPRDSWCEQIALQPTSASTPNSSMPKGAASSIAAESERSDAEQFSKWCKAAAPGEWVVYGVEPAEVGLANLATAQAQLKSAEAAFSAENKKSGTDAKLSSDYARKVQLYRQHASQDALRENDRIIKADQTRLQKAWQTARDEAEAKRAAVEDAQAALRRADVKPVLKRGDLNEWDDFKLMSPVVIKEGNRYRMWYVGCHFIAGEYTCGVGHAQSRDGLVWQKSPAPVLLADDPNASQDLHSITLVRVNGGYLMWYAFDSSLGHECATLDLATSRDGLSWQPQGEVLRANCSSYGRLWPSAFYDGKNIHLWYTDYDSAPSGSLMHATSIDGKNWKADGATSIAALGIAPRRIWVLPDHAGGNSALFAAPRRHFGMLRSSDLKTWQMSDRPPKIAVSKGRGYYGGWMDYAGTSLDEVELEAPAAIAEPSALWIWAGVLSADGDRAEIMLAVQKEGAR
jgi:hypothetical protein